MTKKKATDTLKQTVHLSQLGLEVARIGTAHRLVSVWVESRLEASLVVAFVLALPLIEPAFP